MFAAIDELSRQVLHIDKCHWWIYLSFSTGNSAAHQHHSR